MTDAATALPHSPPYPSSWFDRLADRVEGWPGSPWRLYGGLGLLLFAIMTVIQWRGGAYPIGTFDPFHALVALQTPYALAAMHYLDRKAAAAMDGFRPIFRGSPADFAALRYQLTTLPRRQTLLASLLALILVMAGMWAEYGAWPELYRIAPDGASAAVFAALFAAQWWALGAVFYHTIHQLRVVNRLYTRYTTVDLFRLSPIYLFASLTAHTAGALMVMNAAWVALAPGVNTREGSIGLTIFIAALAAVVFLWPLWGIHRLIVTEKERLGDAVSQRLASVVAALLRRTDGDDIEGVDELNKALTGLEKTRALVEQIPAWPWQPGTLRGVAAAVLLPVGVGLIQWALQRLIEGAP